MLLGGGLRSPSAFLIFVCNFGQTGVWVNLGFQVSITILVLN